MQVNTPVLFKLRFFVSVQQEKISLCYKWRITFSGTRTLKYRLKQNLQVFVSHKHKFAVEWWMRIWLTLVLLTCHCLYCCLSCWNRLGLHSGSEGVCNMWKAVPLLQVVLGREVAINVVWQKSKWKLVKQNVLIRPVCCNHWTCRLHGKLQRYNGTMTLLAS